MNKKTKETLCWTCDNACGNCPWSSDGEPIPNWKATPTYIRNEHAQSYASFKVESCPLYSQTVDFYDSFDGLVKVIVRRTGKSLYLLKEHREATLAAFWKYLQKYPRSAKVSEEDRDNYLKQCIEEELLKEKNKKKREKMSKKLKKI